jgi:mono/diheme cytochrome c family protein
MLLMAALLSACGGSKLAENLTPIPTLPPGAEPTLVDALQGATATPAQAASGGEMTQDQLVAMGKDLFSTNCSACHGAQDGAGPSFTGMADRAATREQGKTAEQYIHESIVDPSADVVDGFSDIMPKDFANKFSDQELNALVAYIMADSGSGAHATPEATTEATVAPTKAPTTEAAAPTTEATQAPTEAPTTEAAAPAGDAAAGAQLFATNCSACHGAQNGAGPALTGMGQRAATRIAGVTAADYIHESIVDPSAYVVDGFSDIMPKDFATKFSDQEINDLVAYILTQ